MIIVNATHPDLAATPLNIELTFDQDDSQTPGEVSVSGDLSKEELNSLIVDLGESSVLGYATSLTNKTPESVLRSLEEIGFYFDWPDEYSDEVENLFSEELIN